MIQTTKKSRPLIYIVLVVFMIISLYPFYMMLIMGTYSQYNMGESASMLPGDNLWNNLKTVYEGGFLKYYGNSFYIAVATTLLAVFISALTGYGIAKFNTKIKKPLYIFVIVAMMVPMQVGMIGYLIEIKYLGLSNTREAIIMYYAANCFGTFWMTQFIRGNVPNEVLESARLDGCGELRMFFRIVLPYLKPAIATLAILQFMWNWNNYLLPLVILSDMDLYPITLGIATLSNQYSTNYPAQICALSLGTLPLILIFIAGSKYFISGLTAGDIKG